MNTSGTFAYLGWPVVVIGGFALMVAFLRWAYSGRHSLVQRRPRDGTPTEYGLLVPVAAPSTYIEGEMLRLRLQEAGIRATLATTTEGPRLMVFEPEAALAEALLKLPPHG